MAASVVEWNSSSRKIIRFDHEDTSVVSRIQQHAGIVIRGAA